MLPATALAALAFLLVGCGLEKHPAFYLSEVRTLAGAKGNLGEPFGIAVENGTVFLSDGENGRILSVANDGALELLTDKLDTPSHIAVDKDGSILVADSGSHTIKRVLRDGTVENVAGVENTPGYRDGDAAQALFHAPVGIAVSGEKIFVADTYNDRIRVIENGNVSTLAGSRRGFADSPRGETAMFDTPCGIALLPGGGLLVADLRNRRIRVVEPDGATRTLAGDGRQAVVDGEPLSSSFSAPTDVAVAPGGEIVVADGDAVRLIAARFLPLVEPVTSKRKGFSDGSAARFNRIGGIAVGSSGEVIAADSGNGLVRIFSSDKGTSLGRREFERTRGDAFDNSVKPDRWPYDPPSRTREIAGTFGEIRGDSEDEGPGVYFHNGLDIVGRYGEEARFVLDEKVLSPEAAQNVGTLRELLRMPRMAYIHINLGRSVDGIPVGDPRLIVETEDGRVSSVRVPRGSKFKAGEVVGTLNRMNHVHLVSGPAGRERNGLEVLRLPGVSDSRRPVINNATLVDQNGERFETVNGSERITVVGSVTIIVDAYDQMDGNADRRRLGVYKLGWSVVGKSGKAVEGVGYPEGSLTFDKLPDFRLTPDVYAFGSKSGATGPTVFRYAVSNVLKDGKVTIEHFDTSRLAPGNYEILVFAEDVFGNRTEERIPITIAVHPANNSGPK